MAHYIVLKSSGSEFLEMLRTPFYVWYVKGNRCLCTYQRPARGVHPRDNRGVHPRDNRGETRGNLVFYLCILPVNPGEITNFAIIGRRGRGSRGL